MQVDSTLLAYKCIKVGVLFDIPSSCLEYLHGNTTGKFRTDNSRITESVEPIGLLLKLDAYDQFAKDYSI